MEDEKKALLILLASEYNCAQFFNKHFDAIMLGKVMKNQENL